MLKAAKSFPRADLIPHLILNSQSADFLFLCIDRKRRHGLRGPRFFPLAHEDFYAKQFSLLWIAARLHCLRRDQSSTKRFRRWLVRLLDCVQP